MAKLELDGEPVNVDEPATRHELEPTPDPDMLQQVCDEWGLRIEPDP